MDPQRLSQVVEDLGSDRFATREATRRDLAQLAAGAEAALRTQVQGKLTLEQAVVDRQRPRRVRINVLLPRPAAVPAGYNSCMTRKLPDRADAKPPCWYRGPQVPLRVIRRYARAVAERFQPEKIILFGSHAYGSPHADSDVDILVIMPARNEIDQAIRIDRAVEPCFPLDLVVCTPKNLAWRLEEGDSFLREIIGKGKVLYEKADGPVGAQGRVRLRRGKENRPRK